MKKVDFYKLFLHYIKMSEKNYHQRNKKIILNRAKYYYKEVLKELLREEKY